MTNCWNADEFEVLLADIYRAADQIRAVLEQSTSRTLIDWRENGVRERKNFWLECHARNFLIDHILSKLNWQLRPSMDAGEYIAANLVTEQNPRFAGSALGEKSVAEHRRRLDYLGYARESDKPLLVVEAKRPNFELPGVHSPLSSPDGHPVARLLAYSLKAARTGEPVPQRSFSCDWREALNQLRDYCRTIANTSDDWPARAVLTNGEWIIVFADPRNAFAETPDSPIQEDAILVFESSGKVQEHSKLLWKHLEYSSLARIDRRIQISQVPFVVDPATIESCSYGLRISYTKKATNYRKAPLLSVSPLLFVRSTGESFIQVVSDWEQEMPVDGRGSMPEHIQEVETECQQLKSQLEVRVLGGRILPLVSVQTHCDSREGLRARPLVQPLYGDDGQRFLVLTGDATHFVLRTNHYAHCEFHRHASGRLQLMARPNGAILESTIEPKSYFVDGSIHHCTHKEVFGVKREKVSETNKGRCGHRSSELDGAFCAIWRFEEFLCCRTCVFNAVCSLAQVYSLPCVELAPPIDGERSNLRALPK